MGSNQHSSLHPKIENFPSTLFLLTRSQPFRSKNGPKKEFILDGVRISVGETNTTQIKTRLERVHQYRLNNSFDIHHEVIIDNV